MVFMNLLEKDAIPAHSIFPVQSHCMGAMSEGTYTKRDLYSFLMALMMTVTGITVLARMNSSGV